MFVASADGVASCTHSVKNMGMALLQPSHCSHWIRFCCAGDLFTDPVTGEPAGNEVFAACLAGSLRDTTAAYQGREGVWQLQENATFRVSIEVLAMGMQRVSGGVLNGDDVQQNVVLSHKSSVCLVIWIKWLPWQNAQHSPLPSA